MGGEQYSATFVVEAFKAQVPRDTQSTVAFIGKNLGAYDFKKGDRNLNAAVFGEACKLLQRNFAGKTELEIQDRDELLNFMTHAQSFADKLPEADPMMLKDMVTLFQARALSGFFKSDGTSPRFGDVASALLGKMKEHELADSVGSPFSDLGKLPIEAVSATLAKFSVNKHWQKGEFVDSVRMNGFKALGASYDKQFPGVQNPELSFGTKDNLLALFGATKRLLAGQQPYWVADLVDGRPPVKTVWTSAPR